MERPIEQRYAAPDEHYSSDEDYEIDELGVPYNDEDELLAQQPLPIAWKRALNGFVLAQLL